jgi:transcription initiation factor TFIIB
MGLPTVIARSDKHASGYEIKPAMVSRMHRLRTWDFRTQVGSGSHQNLRYAFRELDTLKDKLGLPDAIIEKLLISTEKLSKEDWPVEDQYLRY